jgi:hypothetical protein
MHAGFLFVNRMSRTNEAHQQPQMTLSDRTAVVKWTPHKTHICAEIPPRTQRQLLR